MRQFARSTGCKLIAEGVETENERTALVALGIRLAQGYLLGRPGPLPN
jgi:EAL domain-containing protein (putative c-di-GMP-specific phosphodiesterase class I)